MDIFTWAVIAITVIAIIMISIRQRRGRALSLWMLSMGTEPLFTLVKGLTLSRMAGIIAIPVLARHVRSLRAPLFMYLPLLIGLWMLATTFWAPDRSSSLIDGLELILGALALLVPFATHFRAATAVSVAKVISPLVVLSSISVVLFAIFPALERAYYGSSTLAKLVHGPSDVAAINSGELIINVFVRGGLKSGGIFFSNANRASLVLGIAALAYLVVFLLYRLRFALVVSIIAAIGNLATLSKTGIVLLLLLPAGVLFVVLLRRRLIRTLERPLLWATAVLLAAVTVFVVVFGTTFATAINDAMRPRLRLWGPAWDFLWMRPLMGSGEGAWLTYWAPIGEKYGYETVYPPHNFLLEAGGIGGVGVVLAILIFFGCMIVWLWKQIGRAASMRAALVPATLLTAWLWIFIHGFGDNTMYLGLGRDVPFLVIMLLLTVAVSGFPRHESRGLLRTVSWPQRRTPLEVSPTRG